MRMHKLLIVEDHPMTAMITEEIFSSLIEPYKICYAEKMSDLLSVDCHDIDFVLADLQIPGATPEEVLDWINCNLSACKRFFFTSVQDTAVIEKIRESGAVYLSKNTKFKNIVDLVQASLKKDILRTDAPENRSIYQSLIQLPRAQKPLTIKQARVMEHLSLGLSVKETARELHVSPDTVKAHLRDAFMRLEAVNGKEAVSRFLEAKRMAERIYGKEAVQRNLAEQETEHSGVAGSVN